MRRMLDPSFELNKTEILSCVVISDPLLSATSELLEALFLDADLLEEQDVNKGISKRDILHSV